MLRIGIGVVVALVHVQLAFAQEFPKPTAEICGPGGIVIKQALAKAFLRNNDGWRDLYINTAERPQKWRKIYTDKAFCATDPACIADNIDNKKDRDGKPVQDRTAAQQALDDLKDAFTFALINHTGREKAYTIDDPTIGVTYFLGEDSTHAMHCVPENYHEALKPPPGIKTAFRLRSSSDELNIPTADKEAFKGTKPAKVTFKEDGFDTKTQTVTIVGALGYPIPLDFLGSSKGFRYFKGEMVPYISSDQTITRKQGQQATYSASSYVAAGVLINTAAVFDGMPGVNHLFSAKPQYLSNKKDQSEITSFRAIYAPWTWTGNGTTPEINTPFKAGALLGAPQARLLFDLRYDSGFYNNRGIDPATMAQHTSFSRGGTKFGIALATPSFGPHAVLTVSETMLYGFSGEVRNLNLFESELAFYFDSTSNLAFTVSFKKGRDEDTAERVRTWMLGLAAKL